MNIIFTGLIFLMIIILHIIAFIFIIKNFLQIDEVSVKKSLKNTKEEPVLTSIIIGFIALLAIFTGLPLLVRTSISGAKLSFSTHPATLFNKTIYICNFIKGLIFLESAIFLPYGLNLLLYKLWYKKTGLSKRIMLPSIIIGIINFILCVFWIIVEGYINDWATWPWEW
ncbi:MAG: hypothetical protein HDT22_03300 [Ruminococcus sp.]|nr:hypothetical protein [Ruminococcus sp.]